MTAFILIATVAVLALLGALVIAFRTGRRNLHDPAWKPTGFTYSFTGHDQEQGARGRLAAIERQKATSKAADVAPKRSAVIYQMDDERRSRR